MKTACDVLNAFHLQRSLPGRAFGAVQGLAAMALLLWAGMSSAWAGSPIPLEQVATADEFAAEAADRGAELLQLLASEDSFKEFGTKVRQTASLLAVLGQALAEHPQDSKLKAAGPDLRDAANAIARAKMFAEAQAALPRLQAALDGKASGQSKTEFDWAKLTRMRPAMEEMKNRQDTLRRMMRKPKNPDVESRHATVLALLAVTTHADTHEVKNPADVPEWHKYASAMQQQMSKTAAAIKAKDPMAAADAFAAAGQSCQSCHEKFKRQP